MLLLSSLKGGRLFYYVRESTVYFRFLLTKLGQLFLGAVDLEFCWIQTDSHGMGSIRKGCIDGNFAKDESGGIVLMLR